MIKCSFDPLVYLDVCQKTKINIKKNCIINNRSEENEEIIYTRLKPQFYYIKVGFEGV